jgi:hypothetical protein
MLTGSHLLGATSVTFGGTAGTNLSCPTTTSCTVVTPPQGPGTDEVEVATPGGVSPQSSAAQFVYLPFAITEVATESSAANGGGHITKGIGNQIWFTDFDGGTVGRIGHDGTLTQFPTPTANSIPTGANLTEARGGPAPIRPG